MPRTESPSAFKRKLRPKRFQGTINCKSRILVQDGIATNHDATALIMEKNEAARVEQRAKFLMEHAGAPILTVDQQLQIRKLAAGKRKIGHYQNGPTGLPSRNLSAMRCKEDSS
jgi:hypothetical protein